MVSLSHHILSVWNRSISSNVCKNLIFRTIIHTFRSKSYAKSLSTAHSILMIIWQISFKDSPNYVSFDDFTLRIQSVTLRIDHILVRFNFICLSFRIHLFSSFNPFTSHSFFLSIDRPLFLLYHSLRLLPMRIIPFDLHSIEWKCGKNGRKNETHEQFVHFMFYLGIAFIYVTSVYYWNVICCTIFFSFRFVCEKSGFYNNFLWQSTTM